MYSETLTLKYQLLLPKVYFRINSPIWYFLSIYLMLGDKEGGRSEGSVKLSVVDEAESFHHHCLTLKWR